MTHSFPPTFGYDAKFDARKAASAFFQNTDVPFHEIVIVLREGRDKWRGHIRKRSDAEADFGEPIARPKEGCITVILYENDKWGRFQLRMEALE